MIRLTEYLSKQDKLIDDFVSKTLKDRETLQKNIYNLFIDAALLGVASANEEIERLSKKHFSERAIRPLRITLNDVKSGKGIIDKASEFWNKYSLKLAGDFTEQRLEDASKVIQRLIKEGYTQTELQKELDKILEIKDKNRLKQIGITETTKCFNYARVETAKENAKNNGIIRGLKYIAVMDKHTSHICIERNQMVLAIDDPAINKNTPPLHVGCRSIWTFIDKWEWEELGGASDNWDNLVNNPDKSWGNAFAYGGKKNSTENLKNKAKSSIIKMDKMRKQLPSDYCDRIEKILDDAPELCQKVWNKYEGLIDIDANYRGTAHYSPRDNKVRFNMVKDATNIFGKDTTVFYELGHFFDTNSRVDLIQKGHFVPRASNLFNFNDTLKKEAKERVDAIWKELKKEDKKIRKFHAYNQLTQEIKAIPIKARADISDIFEGTIGINCGVGHGKTYWKKIDVSVEAFAEMYSASINNKASLEQIKKYFPESYKIFLKILEEMVR